MPIAKINGANLHYHVKGEGVPIIFLTPPLLTKAIFNYQVAQLSGLYKVVTFDLRGHGVSSKSEAPLTYPLISEDVKQLMDFLDLPKAFICGYSTGASIALEALLTFPDRFHGGILLSGLSEMSDTYNRTRLNMAISACKLKAKKAIAYAICNGNSDSSTTFGNLYREAMRGDIENWEQYYRYSLSYNCTSRLRQIHAPMMLVYGKKDRSFYQYARKLQSELPNNKLIVVNGVAHQLPTKAPVAVSNLMKSWIHDTLPSTREEKSVSPEPFMIDAVREQEMESNA